MYNIKLNKDNHDNNIDYQQVNNSNHDNDSIHSNDFINFYNSIMDNVLNDFNHDSVTISF